MSDIVVKSLYIFPIKSLGGISVPHFSITDSGIYANYVYDRRFMLIDAENNMITQRTHGCHKLAALTTSFGRDTGQIVVTELRDSDDRWGVRKDLVIDPRDITTQQVTVSMHSRRIRTAEGERETVVETTPAHIMNSSAHEWFSEYLRRDVRLVQQTDFDERYCDSTLDKSLDKHRVSLADGSPVTIISMATIRQIDPNKPETRYRNNIVVDGGVTPNAENSWDEIDVGKATLSGKWPKTRCMMTGIPQYATDGPNTEPADKIGVYEGPEVIKALSKTSRVNYWQNDQLLAGVVAGENMVPIEPGRVRLGDKVVINRLKPMPQFMNA